MAGDGVMEFGNWIVLDALKGNPCVKVSEFPDELTCIVYDEHDNAIEWRVYVPKGLKCSECKERQGYYLDAETIKRQQERIAKLTVERDAYFEMVKRVQADCDARDALIRDMWAGIVREHPQGGFPDMGLMEKRMRELGIEVDR